MRLAEVEIGEFKNLRDFRVRFDATSPYTVLVGENGSGKSNLIEALTLIFRNLDLNTPPPFPYRIKYFCRNNAITIHADTNRKQRYWVQRPNQQTPTTLSKRNFMSDDEHGRPHYRPAFVFGYYSRPQRPARRTLREASRALLQRDYSPH